MKACIDCGLTKETKLFNRTLGGFRPECKECEKERRQARRQADPVAYAANIMAQGVLKRTKYHIDRPANAVYKRLGIKNELGDNIADIRKLLLDNFRENIESLLAEGKTPTIDRVNNRGNYALENIRIISLEENSGLADLSSVMRPVLIIYKNGEEKHFESISEAAEKLKCKRDTVYASHANNRWTRYGWKARIS